MVYTVLCGTDLALLEIRAAVLRTAAFQTAIAVGLSELEELATGRQVDLLVLCHSLQSKEQEQATRNVRALWTSTKTIVLSKDGCSTQAAAGSICLNIFEGPQALIKLSKKIMLDAG